MQSYTNEGYCDGYDHNPSSNNYSLLHFITTSGDRLDICDARLLRDLDNGRIALDAVVQSQNVSIDVLSPRFFGVPVERRLWHEQDGDRFQRAVLFFHSLSILFDRKESLDLPLSPCRTGRRSGSTAD